MSITQQAGLEINLFIFLTKNRLPFIGQTGTVTVIDIIDGSELLAKTSLVETSPGLYRILWTTTPKNPTGVSVRYQFDRRVFHESITFLGDPGRTGALDGELIASTDTIEGQIVKTDTTFEGELVERPTLEGELISEETLEGELIESNNVLEGELVDE